MKTIKKEEQTSGGGTSWTGKRIKETASKNWIPIAIVIAFALIVVLTLM